MTSPQEAVDQLTLRLFLSHNREGFEKSLDVAVVSTLLVVRAVQSMPIDYQQSAIESLIDFIREQVPLP
jgi:hypothetical protein